MSQLKCRVCFKQQEDYGTVNIFHDEMMGDIKCNIANIIEQHLGFRPLLDDKLSKVICKICWRILCDFHEFYNKVLEVQQNAFDLSDQNLNLALPEAIIILDEIKEEPICELSLGTENVLSKADLVPDAIDNPLKIVDDNENNGCIQDNEGNEYLSNNSSDSLYEDDGLKDKIFASKLFSKRASRSQVKSNQTNRQIIQTSKARRKPKNCTEEDIVNQQRGSKRKMSRKNDYNVTDDELIRKHIPFNCGICADNVKDFAELKKHFEAKHDSEERAYIRCCGRKISCTQRNYLIQHAYRHENPEHFKCKDCQKVFADNDGLRWHIVANHPHEDDLKFECDQCEKRFAKQSLLDYHKASHMPESERKFICTRCPMPKAFANNRLLSTHTFNAHKRPKNVCHICAKVIADKAFFEKHVRAHTEQNQPRVKCPIQNCESWLKDQYSLKEHLRRHDDEGKVFECEICGKRSSNRKALRSHIRTTHSSKIFSCEQCSKTFKSALSLKEHMAQHTGESLYKCPFCERTFNSKANMHSHKKKQHPVEWALSRKAKMYNEPPPLIISNDETKNELIESLTQTADNFFMK